MRIGIDMLSQQSSTRRRGIVRYTRQFVWQFLARHPQHEYFLYRHSGLPGADDRWPGDPHLRSIACDPAGDFRHGARRIADENEDQLDVLLQTAPLEQLGEQIPPAKSPTGPKLAAMLYDLVPLLFQELYLTDPQHARLYFQAVRRLRQYDLLLATSENTRLDAQRSLQLGADQIIAVGAASDSAFFAPDRAEPMPAAVRAALDGLGAAEPFVFGMSSLESRKNLRGLIQAFALLPEPLRRQYRLVVACQMSDEECVRWRDEARRLGAGEPVLLAHYLTDETLRVLYQRCAAFASPAFYEGFGLPLLEALHCGAPVLAGLNSSQPEVVGEAGLFADADSPAEISSQLARLLSEPELAADLRRRGPEQARRFCWQTTTDRAVAAIEQVVRARPPVPRRALRRSAPQRRIAFFSPLPPKRSGIADYSQRLLEHLREHYIVDLYHAPEYVPHLSLASSDFACHDFRLFPRYYRALDYHGVAYHMGNSKYHGYIYQTLLKYPGVVTVHDFNLAGFHYWFSFQPDAAADHFVNQLARENPDLAAEFLAEGDHWKAESGGIAGACNRRGAWLNQEILLSAASIVVHDPWVAQQICLRRPELAARLRVIPHGADSQPCSAERRRQIRRQFGIPLDALLFGCFGILHSTKCNVEAVEAFAAVARRHPEALLLFVGRDRGDGEAQAKAAALGLGERVRFLGYTPIEAFRELAAATDIGVNLRRPPTNGETSGALITLLSSGVASVVIDVDTFSSYPDDVVRKVRWSPQLVQALAEAFGELADNPDERIRRGRAALEHIGLHHGWARSAELYVEAIEDVYQRRQARTAAANASAIASSAPRAA